MLQTLYRRADGAELISLRSVRSRLDTDWTPRFPIQPFNSFNSFNRVPAVSNLLQNQAVD
jgi:hypothetical protein